MRRIVPLVAVLAAALPAAGEAAPAARIDPVFAVDAAAAAAGLALAPLPITAGADAVPALGVSHSDLDRLRTDLSPDASAAVERVLHAVATATQAHRQAWAAVPRDAIPATLADPAQAPVRLAGLDRALLLSAQRLLADTVASEARALAGIRLARAECFGGRVLCIGTDGDDVWTEDVQILIDPAGNDRYLNNAGGSLQSAVVAATAGCVLGGGSTGRGRPNLECSPAPSSVCTYDTLNRATGREDLPVAGLPGHADPEGPQGGDGNAGSCGSDARREQLVASAMNIGSDDDARAVTLLADLDGADTYTVPWSHEDPLFGLIEDCFPGEESRVNTNRDFVQGGALAGLSLAWDAGTGDDVFRGRLNVQGSGHIGGVGMLAVTGAGDTTFWADRLSQGSGTAAGIGIVANTATGAQRYLLDPPEVYRNEFAPNARDCQQEGRAGQGQGGFGGIGVLVTAGGTSSTYRAVTHAVENAHPYRPILTSSGAPKLVRGTDAQGSGEAFPLIATSGGIVAGGGLLLDATDGDTRACATHPRAGMLSGSATSSGTDLSTMGIVDRSCGKFNVLAELDPAADLPTAMQRLLAGAVGARVVVPR